jgi:NAD(P)-dependent dehydrogenase (short-subunit alcohol dehydrogenase family)
MPEQKRLQDRVAVVTGGARGIGEAIAQRLAAEGARVLIADIDGKVASETAHRLAQQTGSPILGLRADIAEPASAEAAVATAVDSWGRLDILVNNAAVLDMTPLNKLTYERFSHVLRINLDGVLICTVAAVRHLAKSPCARILNIASILGMLGNRDSLSYGTAKGGVVNLTRCLACDLADRGILVNAIAPGFVDTRMARMPDGSHEHETEWFKEVYLKHGRLPLGRAGQPADIAGAAFFLCSDDSRYITGQVLMVDGGVSATF